ncbi:xylulokinase [Maribacter sp. 2-571]|uniref:xylulokinase n=1 Tax=Maribacter sp. 2-571 TaxID=3417569 RepID=UPI003D345745
MNHRIKQRIINGETSLGIELGSTRIKVVLIDNKFETIDSSSYEWENQLIDGYWTYDLDKMIIGIEEAYGNLKSQIERDHKVTIQNIGSIGCSAMMQGYIALDTKGNLLVPFRTWRNATTGEAASELTEQFKFKIPQRWSIAHLYQSILNDEEHVANIGYLTTLSGYIHWRLTGTKAIGIGDASGMFPIDESARRYDEIMLDKFEDLISDRNYHWNLRDILPKVHVAGENAGYLSKAGAHLLDSSDSLQAGIPLCPPEGDAGTGMVATNSVKKRTGNISVGTSIFAMFVLEKGLSTVYPEIDIIATPDGSPAGMVLANNCSSDINAWVGLFGEFYEAMGQKTDSAELFNMLFNKALEADADGGGLLSYGYYSGENITGLAEGRPLFVRSPKSNFNLANFMRTHLFAAFAALRIGMDIFTKKEKLKIDGVLAHGGLFKTPLVAQKMLAAALNVPVSVMSTAGEGGAWGMAILANYMKNKETNVNLASYLSTKVFANVRRQEISPDITDVDGFNVFLEHYKSGLTIEKAAVENFKEN